MFEKIKALLLGEKCNKHPDVYKTDSMVFGDNWCSKCTGDEWSEFNKRNEDHERRKLIDACKIALVEMYVVSIDTLPDDLKKYVKRPI